MRALPLFHLVVCVLKLHDAVPDQLHLSNLLVYYIEKVIVSLILSIQTPPGGRDSRQIEHAIHGFSA